MRQLQETVTHHRLTFHHGTTPVSSHQSTSPSIHYINEWKHSPEYLLTKQMKLQID